VFQYKKFFNVQSILKSLNLKVEVNKKGISVKELKLKHMLEGSGVKYLEHPFIWQNTVEFRLYQKKIADIASERNTLIILPTALGKTVISAIVSANILYNYRNTKVLVMAPTRPLVMQHKSSFNKFLKLKDKDTILLTGKTPPNYRTALWKNDARIVFSTPQVVRNDLLKKRLTLENYGLLIFDECHRAVKKYAYTEIAKFYVSQAKYPLILGMTASPGSELNTVLDICRNLFIEQVEYRKEEDPDVKDYIQPISIEWKRVNLPSEYLEIRVLIKTMLTRRLYWLYNLGIIKNKPRYATRRNLIEAGNDLRGMLEESAENEKGQIFMAIINQSLALTLFHMLELLETQGLWTLKIFLNKVKQRKSEKRSYAILVNEPEYKKVRSYIDAFSIEHPKLGILKQIVGNQIRIKPSSRMIVFTQYRDTTNHLVLMLNTINSVKAERFVGQASKISDKGLTQKEQTARIKRLEDGSINVLVATSIAEEGLDIPSVDHVIFYEPIPSEIRYIQRRGRTGRKNPGKVTILVTNDSLDMIYLYASRRKTEKMKRIAEKLNTKLQPIMRTSTKPIPNPLTLQELEIIEKEVKNGKVEAKKKITEIKTLREINRKVERTARKLYLKLLKEGSSGVGIERLTNEMELEGVTPPILKNVIEKLMKEGVIAELKPRRYVTTASLKATGKTYVVIIEKIYPNSALVIVDDKWKAILVPANYNGPRSLIKKNSKFRALAQLYKLEEVLNIRVKEVIEIL
jgi:Fanconi anemia group M protein